MAKIITFQDIQNLPEQELLNTKLSFLKLSLKHSSTFIQVKEQLVKDLRNKGIAHTPHFWISDEWFCADGVFGVAVPFYLFHPRLIRIEKREIGFCEGSSKSEMLKLLRHECGHAFDNAYHLRKMKRRQKLFGLTSKRYPQSYKPNTQSKDYVSHLTGHYAQAHPDEDWAETFAVWLSNEKGLQKKYFGTKAYEKIQYIESVFSKKHTLKCKKKATVEPLSELDITLREYLRLKKFRLKVAEYSPAYKVLKETLSSTESLNQNNKLFHFLLGKEQLISQKLAKSGLMAENKAMQVVLDLKNTCKLQKLSYSKPISVASLIQTLAHPKVINYAARETM